MEYFEVNFKSHSNFQQMMIGNDDQTVRMFCQKNEGENSVKEIIINLPTPENYNDEEAQFSISKEEAELMISVFKFHFGI